MGEKKSSALVCWWGEVGWKMDAVDADSIDDGSWEVNGVVGMDAVDAEGDWG